MTQTWNIMYHFFFPNEPYVSQKELLSTINETELRKHPSILKFINQIKNDNPLIVDLVFIEIFLNPINDQVTIKFELVINSRMYQRYSLLNIPKELTLYARNGFLIKKSL